MYTILQIFYGIGDRFLIRRDFSLPIYIQITFRIYYRDSRLSDGTELLRRRRSDVCKERESERSLNPGNVD